MTPLNVISIGKANNLPQGLKQNTSSIRWRIRKHVSKSSRTIFRLRSGNCLRTGTKLSLDPTGFGAGRVIEDELRVKVEKKIYYDTVLCCM